MAKIFKGFEVDQLGRILSTIDGLNCEHINCPATTGHLANIVSHRKNDVEITYYEHQHGYGAEVYFFKLGTHNIKYSRNYSSLRGLPKKYEEIVDNLRERHILIFKN